MTKYHMKRLPSPNTWRIGKKDWKYITRPHPGGHEFNMGISLNTLMIGLGLAKTKKEVKHILQHKEVLVDGKKRHDVKHLVGFMDVLALPQAKENYRVLITSKGIQAVPIDEKEAKTKLVKVTGKSHVKGGKTQVHTHDGRNILLDKDNYKVGDSLVIELPSQKEKEHLKMEEGATILLYRGQHAGAVGTVDEIEGKRITFTSGKDKFETRRAYAFVVGKGKPVMKVQADE